VGNVFIGRGTYSAIGAIRSLGLTTNLQLCLDAGDVVSYSGSGQSWLDTSGNGYDFFRGAGVGAAANDPTFNGSAGALTSSEYWSFDGGDYFTYDTTNETWMQNVHKNNATITFVWWIYSANPAAAYGIAGTDNNGSAPGDTGFHINYRTTGVLRFVVNDESSPGNAFDSTAAITGGWTFGAVSIDEAAAAGIRQIDTTQETFTATYSAPSTNAASYTMQIGAAGNANAPPPNGSQMTMLCAWSRALSATEIMDLFNATRDRFGV
jgi:hypothetical protein